jgi:hypothetical protein
LEFDFEKFDSDNMGSDSAVYTDGGTDNSASDDASSDFAPLGSSDSDENFYPHEERRQFF